jgi:hypothetical protein
LIEISVIVQKYIGPFLARNFLRGMDGLGGRLGNRMKAEGQNLEAAACAVYKG